MTRPNSIFLSYADEDRDQAAELYKRLEKAGFSPWMDSFDVLPGQVRQLARSAALWDAGFIILLLSRSSLRDLEKGLHSEYSNIVKRWIEEPKGEAFLIPALLEPCEIPGVLEGIQPVYLYESNGFDRLKKSLRLAMPRRTVDISERFGGTPNLHIANIELTNVRCFDTLSIDFTDNGVIPLWTTILGDNAGGKTTLLRSIALGLCSESDAVALMKEIPGGIIRHDEREAWIRLTLRDDDGGGPYVISTGIQRSSPDASEIVRQHTEPEENFPWNDVFVCGYGTQRTAFGHTSYEKYSILNAVQTLFNDEASLQNPEVVLLRQEPALRRVLEEMLLEILLLDAPDSEVTYPRKAPEVRGPWGSMPFGLLSDGYRSTAQWVLDFIGWLIYAERFFGKEQSGGILLIDELEQHLHPRWQRHIAQRLRRHFRRPRSSSPRTRRLPPPEPSTLIARYCCG